MHSRSLPLLRSLSLLCLSAALLAGCGSSSSSSSASAGNGLASKSPEQIVAAAKAASEGAATVHISGSVIAEGKPISLDMELVAGKGAKGHLTLEGNGLDIIEVEHAFYINGSTAFYTRVAGAAAARLLQGKWLKASTSGKEFASFAQLTNLGKLLASSLGSHGKLKSAGTATIDRQPAVGVTDTQEGGTLYVAATGTPYPLQISKGAGGAGTITLDRWNQPVTLTAPPNPINVNQLQSGK
jgi:hypothetical protein